MAAAIANLRGSSHIFSPLPKSLQARKPHNKHPKLNVIATKCSQVDASTTSRRASIGLIAAAALFSGLPPLHAEEENNGWWINGPLPVPTFTNKIANEETGTRSFLRKGIYMADIGADGSTLRLKHYAFDLQALGDLLGQDAWSYISKYLCLKSTVMYYDFDKVISAAPDHRKQPLLRLANQLFDSVEQLEDAVKKRSDPLTRSIYNDTSVILEEVMAKME